MAVSGAFIDVGHEAVLMLYNLVNKIDLEHKIRIYQYLCCN